MNLLPGGAVPTGPVETAAVASPATPTPAALPTGIPESFQGTWAALADTCALIRDEGLEPPITITATEVRDAEYETFCKLTRVLQASPTEVKAELSCTSNEEPTAALQQRTFALAAGRLVFGDRPVSYVRCTEIVPAPPVELAQPIESPPAAAKDINLKVPDDMTPQHFVNFTWNSLFCSGIITEELRHGTVPPDAHEAFRTIAQGYQSSAEELAKRAGLSESEFAAQRDREIPAEVRKVYELAGTSGDVRRGLTEQLDTCVKHSKTMLMLAMAMIYEDAKAREYRYHRSPRQALRSVAGPSRQTQSRMASGRQRSRELLTQRYPAIRKNPARPVRRARSYLRH